MGTTTHPTYLTSDEAAQLLHYTTGHLANLRSKGTGLPYHKVGRRCLYRREDIEAYISDSRIEPLTA